MSWRRVTATPLWTQAHQSCRMDMPICTFRRRCLGWKEYRWSRRTVAPASAPSQPRSCCPESTPPSTSSLHKQDTHTHTQVRQAHKPQQPQQPQIPQIRRRVGDRAQRAAAASAYAGGWQRGM